MCRQFIILYTLTCVYVSVSYVPVSFQPLAEVLQSWLVDCSAGCVKSNCHPQNYVEMTC